MQQTEIYKRLTAVFRDVFDNDALELGPDLTAADVPEWDSFSHINLIVAIEAEFEIEFQAVELEAMHHVGNLVEFIEKKLAAQKR